MAGVIEKDFGTEKRPVILEQRSQCEYEVCDEGSTSLQSFKKPHRMFWN